MLFKSKKDLADSPELFDTPEIKEFVMKSRSAEEVLDPWLRYTYEVTKAAADKIKQLHLDAERTLIFTYRFFVLLYFVKLTYFLYTSPATVSWWRILFEESIWTIPLLIVLYLFMVYNTSASVGYTCSIILKETALAYSLCYDRLYTQPDYRELLFKYTPPVMRDALVQEKGYLSSLIDLNCSDIINCFVIGNHRRDCLKLVVEKYSKVLNSQYNTNNHFEANYKKLWAIEELPTVKPE